MNISTKFSTTLLTIIFATAVLIAGCDNPAGDDHEEHADPAGLQLVMNGEVLLTYMNNEVSGQLNLVEGVETDLITVEWLDENGEEIHGEDLDEAYSLDWEIEDENIAQVERHNEDGRWSFHMHGESAGVTKIQLMLLHGDHADLSTPAVNQDDAITVNVEAQNS